MEMPAGRIRGLAVVLATCATLLAVAASPVSAASGNISGTTNSSSFVCYSTIRSVTTEWGGTVSFAPNNLLGVSLSVRLNDSNCGALSTARHWVQEEQGLRKNLLTGLSQGAQFRMGACCVAPQDSTWGGNLRW